MKPTLENIEDLLVLDFNKYHITLQIGMLGFILFNLNKNLVTLKKDPGGTFWLA